MTNQELVNEFCKYYFAFQQIATNPKIKQHVKDKFVKRLNEIELNIQNNKGKIILPPKNTTFSPEPVIEFIVLKDSKKEISRYTLNYTHCRIPTEILLNNIHSM